MLEERVERGGLYSLLEGLYVTELADQFHCNIAELLDYYSLQEMLQFFTDKYAATDIGFVVRSLTYFEGAEISKDPILLKKIDWKQVKQKIEQAVQDFWRE